MHDTIPFRYPPSRALAPLMRAYISWMARHSTLVVTDSEFSKQSLQEDLGLDPDRIVVLAARDRPQLRRAGPRPANRRRARRTRSCSSDATPRTRISTGSCAPSVRPTSRRAGAVLTLAGVDGAATTRLQQLADRHRVRVELPGIVSQPGLEQLLASATLLVQPSLEEGFGLPVAEALAAGIPVAISTAPALLEITRGAPVVAFDPLDDAAISAAIDRVAASPGPVPSLAWPTPVDFARSVLAAIERARVDGSLSGTWKRAGTV